MFDFGPSPLTVPADLADVARSTWRQVASTGTWWNGTDRVALAEAARSARTGASVRSGSLPPAAVEVAVMVGATPAHTTREWVAAMVGELGEEAYIEAASVASRIAAIDTFTRLLGGELQPFPNPSDGDPPRTAGDPPPKRTRAWVGMSGFPTPPNTFSAVPAEAESMVAITDAFYMPEFDMQYADQRRRGLHRTQIETVAGVTSHSNECFY